MQLPERPARHYLRADFDPTSTLDVETVLSALAGGEPRDFRTAFDWFSLFQEVSVALSEAHTRLELAVQLDHGNKEAERSLQLFEENILSRMLVVRGELMDVYMNSSWRTSMHADDHDRLYIDFLNRRKYASPKTAELQIQENQIVREYRLFMNQAEVQFLGRKTPVSVIIGKLNDPRADVRRPAFSTYWTFIKESEERLQGIFDKLLTNRQEQAEIVGAEDFVDFAFAELGRLDYGPSDCASLRLAIEKAIVPTMSSLASDQAKGLATQVVHAADAGLWPGLMPELPPAGGDLEHLIDAVERIIRRIHPAFGDLFADMRARGLIDVAPRQRKSAGAFCVTFQETGMPFVFGNFSATYRDAMTFIHEFGHAIHGYATAKIPNVLLRHPGLEFCEVASMGLEMLASEYFSELWSAPRDVHRARGFQAFSALNFWPFMAMIDGWQHEVYRSPKSFDASARNRTWLELSRRFRPHISWEGAEEFESLGWFSRPHIFTSPFYYVDYGIAQIGAVDLWRQHQESPEDAVRNYIRGLSLGAQRNLRDLFKALGTKLDFSGETLLKQSIMLQKVIIRSLEVT